MEQKKVFCRNLKEEQDFLSSSFSVGILWWNVELFNFECGEVDAAASPTLFEFSRFYFTLFEDARSNEEAIIQRTK